MTTVAAVKKGKSVSLATDSLATHGSRRELPGTHTLPSSKILRLGDNYLGIAGHASWDLLLKHYASPSEKAWKNSDEIFAYFTAFHTALKKDYLLLPPSLQHIPFESSEGGFLIVNRWGIFEVDYARVVREHNHFTAIGTGEEYALGAMAALYDEVEESEEIAKKGIEAASLFDRKTALPVCAETLHVNKSR